MRQSVKRMIESEDTIWIEYHYAWSFACACTAFVLLFLTGIALLILSMPQMPRNPWETCMDAEPEQVEWQLDKHMNTGWEWLCLFVLSTGVRFISRTRADHKRVRSWWQKLVWVWMDHSHDVKFTSLQLYSSLNMGLLSEFQTFALSCMPTQIVK